MLWEGDGRSTAAGFKTMTSSSSIWAIAFSTGPQAYRRALHGRWTARRA